MNWIRKERRSPNIDGNVNNGQVVSKETTVGLKRDKDWEVYGKKKIRDYIQVWGEVILIQNVHYRDNVEGIVMISS